MCYSGICAWEDYMGDCRFPYNKVVRDKYPFPICGIPYCEEDMKYFDEVYTVTDNTMHLILMWGAYQLIY